MPPPVRPELVEGLSFPSCPSAVTQEKQPFDKLRANRNGYDPTPYSAASNPSINPPISSKFIGTAGNAASYPLRSTSTTLVGQ